MFVKIDTVKDTCRRAFLSAVMSSVTCCLSVALNKVSNGKYTEECDVDFAFSNFVAVSYDLRNTQGVNAPELLYLAYVSALSD
jgi:hypothetical protein